MKKDLVAINDLTSADVAALLTKGIQLKKDKKRISTLLAGKTVVLIFEKPSLRTRVTFETGVTQLGGHAIYLEAGNIQPGKRESVKDIARNLERWVDGIVARTFSHETVTSLASNGNIPVINALSDLEHPCQALACMMTLQERFRSLRGKKFVYVGDGNNVANSLLAICPKVGMHFTICCPESFEPNSELWAAAQAEAKRAGTSMLIERDKYKAVDGAAVVYTDVWTSMGQEHEYEKRMRIFKPFQVNESLMKRAPKDCLVTHCLPAHRGEEITDGVIDGPRSIAFDEAENRLHVQKAVMLALVGKKK
jgi:ornithine carbamoyltransferase